MKYLKRFNENIENTFKYSFEFPVIKRYELKDDGYWTWDEVCDYLKQEQGIDLKKDVADELGIDKREVSNDQIDEFANSYGGNSRSWEKFKNEYSLDYDEYEISQNDYKDLQNDFNNSKLEQYFESVYDNTGQRLFLSNLRVTDCPDRHPEKIHGSFEVNSELDESQILDIKDYISGQCSDGWGEGYEQKKFNDVKISGLKFSNAISPWWNKTSTPHAPRRVWKLIINKI